MSLSNELREPSSSSSCLKVGGERESLTGSVSRDACLSGAKDKEEVSLCCHSQQNCLQKKAAFPSELEKEARGYTPGKVKSRRNMDLICGDSGTT